MVNTISHQVTAWMVEGCEDKKNGFRVVLKHTGYFSYFVTQNARHAFAAVVVSLVIRCMLYYYMYHVVLHLSQLEENKLWVPSLLIRVSHYLWRTPQVLFHTVRVGCFLLWWRSWSYSRNQPPIKRSKPNWWSQLSLLRKAFSVVDVFKKSINGNMVNNSSLSVTLFRIPPSGGFIQELVSNSSTYCTRFCICLVRNAYSLWVGEMKIWSGMLTHCG